MYNLPNVDARGMMVHEFWVKEGYCVKYIFQFARITAFCLAGEVLAAVLPLPIPASVYGLLLMVAALKTGLLKLEQVRIDSRIVSSRFRDNRLLLLIFLVIRVLNARRFWRRYSRI